MRAIALCCLVFAGQASLFAQGDGRSPLTLLDIPFISQSEALCGGAAAAMVLRYWGEREVTAETFAPLLERGGAGIGTDVLVADLRRRGWQTTGIRGDEALIQGELARGRPVLALVEDRPTAFHYVVIVAWHDRGVIFHDPARAPFVVLSTREFGRRWRAAREWMAVIVPGQKIAGSDTALPHAVAAPSKQDASPCEQAVADGVRHARANELEAAERTLAPAALACPAAARELAAVRVLQKRWGEATDLAASVVSLNEADAYAWKVLATSRFVQQDVLGALSAWNHVGEPRVDIVRIAGVTHTRHRTVESLLDVKVGELLTREKFTRSARQLSELPSATSSRLEYVPVRSGLAEVRGHVAERPRFPLDRLSLAAIALVAATTREVRVTTGSLFGGGEAFSAAWRAWPERRRLSGDVRAPAPWGGTWRVEGFSERQSFTVASVPRTEREGMRLALSNWVAGSIRVEGALGADQRPDATRATVGGSIRWVAVHDRIDTRTSIERWIGSSGFTTLDIGVRTRSSTMPRGTVIRGEAALQTATRMTPVDLWSAGDTGTARPTLLRAHPALDGGRLRVDRVGRTLIQGSLEAQRWWRVFGPVSAAAAVFGDSGRVASRYAGRPLTDLDVGVGGRLAIAGVPGMFRVDAARGLRDGAAAISVAYEP